MASRSSSGARSRGAEKSALPARKTQAQLKADAKAAKAAAAAAVQRRAEQRATLTARALDRLSAARARNPSAFAGRTTLPRGILSEAAVRTLAPELPKMAPLLAERRLIIDRGSGRILIDKKGKDNAVGVFNGVGLNYAHTAKYPQGEKMVARGQVDIHNHPFLPDSYPTINDWDYEEASRWVKPGMIGALTEGGFAVIQPKSGTWPSYARVVDPAIARHWKALDLAMVKQIRRGGNAAALNLSDGDLMHLVWRAVAHDPEVQRAGGLRYARVPMAAVGRTTPRARAGRGGQRKRA